MPCVVLKVGVLSKCVFLHQQNQGEGTITSKDNDHFSESQKATRFLGIGFHQEHGQGKVWSTSGAAHLPVYENRRENQLGLEQRWVLNVYFTVIVRPAHPVVSGASFHWILSHITTTGITK